MSSSVALPAVLTVLWIVLFAVTYQPLKESLFTAGLPLNISAALLFAAFIAGLFLLGRWMRRQNRQRCSS